MVVKIAHASISENNAINGDPGDQTGREVCITDWYNKPWNSIIRIEGDVFKGHFADAMEQAAKNNKIGYGQQDRYGAWDEYVALINPKKILGPTLPKLSDIKKNCNCDCSSLVGLALFYALLRTRKGILTLEDVLPDYIHLKYVTTFTLQNVMRSTLRYELAFFTEPSYRTKPDKLLRGDILLNTSSHVAVCVTGGYDEDITGKVFQARFPALSFDAAIKGTKTVHIDDVPGNYLALRDGPGTEFKELVRLPRGTFLYNYGYYTNDYEKVWLYVSAKVNGIEYTGHVLKSYTLAYQ